MLWRAYWPSLLFQLPINFVRIFCHLLRICVELFTLPNFVLSLPVKAIISSIPFSAAMLIRRSVLCTLRVTFSWFHIIFIVFRPVISAINITYIIRQYHCRIHTAPSPLLPYKLSITVARNSHRTTNTDGNAVMSPILTDTCIPTNLIRNTTTSPQASKKIHKQLLRSTRAQLFRIQRNKQSNVPVSET
jgi:hypothetical protein